MFYSFMCYHYFFKSHISHFFLNRLHDREIDICISFSIHSLKQRQRLSNGYAIVLCICILTAMHMTYFTSQTLESIKAEII